LHAPGGLERYGKGRRVSTFDRDGLSFLSVSTLISLEYTARQGLAIDDIPHLILFSGRRLWQIVGD
jgi:hypothetical protein